MAYPQHTEEQISIFREVFSLYASDEDETIFTTDLAKVTKCLGCHFTHEELENLTKEVDPKEYGVINFHQFLGMMSQNLKPKPTMEDRCREVFRYFDVDGKDFITSSDLHQAMINLGEDLKKYDIEQMIKAAAIEEDGKVSFDEFVKIATSNNENI